jgi:hypothetical protein
MKVLSSRCEAELWRKCEVVLKRAAKEARSATCTLCTNSTFALGARKTSRREGESRGGGMQQEARGTTLITNGKKVIRRVCCSESSQGVTNRSSGKGRLVAR